MKRIVRVIFSLGVLLMVLSVPTFCVVKKDFSGDVGLVKEENHQYVFQVTAENKREDFTGYVRVIFEANDQNACAFDTKIVLPAQGEKQFFLTVPKNSVNAKRGGCSLSFVSQKGETLESISIKNVFGNTANGIPVGILSDRYGELDYLGLNGETIYLDRFNYPVSLVNCNEQNISENLDGLLFLVIDAFDVSSLPEESIQKIQDWVEKGGCLILGTGAYANETLSGFEPSFLDVTLMGISEAGGVNSIVENAARDDYYYYSYKNEGVDFSRMSVAEFILGSNHYYSQSSDNPGYLASVKDGVIMLLSVSLSDPEISKVSSDCVLRLYEECYYNSKGLQNSMGAGQLGYQGQRAFAKIDNANTSVDFGWLKVMIGVYVVLVGPVLYLILRKCKRSEWYWGFAPVLGLLFIGVVYVFGQGAKVREANVYSVTSKPVDGNTASTYMLAYRAGLKEWTLPLDESYQTAGPGLLDDSYYSGTPADYHYVIKKDEEGLSGGIKPTETFESAFLFGTKTSDKEGNITGENLVINEFDELTGTVRNETDRDFVYLAVATTSSIYVIADVKAGETVSLEKAASQNRIVYQSNSMSSYEDVFYDMVDRFYMASQNSYYKEEHMAALYIGLMQAYESFSESAQNAILAGLVTDYDKSVDGKCMETSYGCLYAYTNLVRNESTLFEDEELDEKPIEDSMLID